MHIGLSDNRGACTADHLSQRLSLLSMLPAAANANYKALQPKASVYIGNVSLTYDIMTTLSRLPALIGEVTLKYCDYPLEPSAYRDLAQQLPTTYTHFDLGYADEMLRDDERLKGNRLQCAAAFMDGVNARRAALGLEPATAVLAPVIVTRERLLRHMRHKAIRPIDASF